MKSEELFFAICISLSLWECKGKGEFNSKIKFEIFFLFFFCFYLWSHRLKERLQIVKSSFFICGRQR